MLRREQRRTPSATTVANGETVKETTILTLSRLAAWADHNVPIVADITSTPTKCFFTWQILHNREREEYQVNPGYSPRILGLNCYGNVTTSV